MVVPRDQHAEQNHRIKIGNKSFERVNSPDIFGTTLANQNSSQGKIKSRLQSGNACCYLVQNILSSSLLSENKDKKYTEL
jgi:hypothetical protein